MARNPKRQFSLAGLLILIFIISPGFVAIREAVSVANDRGRQWGPEVRALRICVCPGSYIRNVPRDVNNRLIKLEIPSRSRRLGTNEQGRVGIFAEKTR